MRKIISTTWVTLDGFIAGPNGEMDWVIVDEEMGQYEFDAVSAADTLLLGRVTYQSFAGAWPTVPENPSASKGEVEYAHKLNAMRKIVFSKTLSQAEWNNSQVFSEIDPEAIQRLKEEEGKDMLIYGSASIVQQLASLGIGRSPQPRPLPTTAATGTGPGGPPRCARCPGALPWTCR